MSARPTQASEREVVTVHEAFLIGMLQAVAGGSMVAGLSQAEPVIKLIGKLSFLIFLTMVSSALLAAVLAAYWRHECRKWNLKANASRARGNVEEAEQRFQFADRDLRHTRGAFLASLIFVLGAYAVMIVAMWFKWTVE
jgi:hypothetical protein